jgi:serine/threonine protein kinase
MVVKGYKVLEPIGRGGMGDVYKAKHLKSESYAAIKFLNATFAAPKVLEVFKRRFEVEGKNLMRLRGTTHIANVYDISEEEPYAIITEYVEGVPFSACLESEGLWSPTSQLRLFEVVVKMAKALVTVHREDIVHRDVKPDNIMIKDPDEKSLDPRLIDFGISKVEPDEGDIRLTIAASAAMGSVMTAAPEQLRGHMDIGPTADIYSLGIIAYMIFNKGNHLYGSEKDLKGQTQVEALMWATGLAEDETRTKDALKEIDPRAAKVIGPCIRAYPLDRTQTAEEAHRQFAKLYLELLMEQQAKSAAMTSEVQALDEKDLEPEPKAEPSAPETIYGMPTNPGVTTPPDSGDETVKNLVPPTFEKEDGLDPEPKLHREVRPKSEPKPAVAEEEESSRRKVWLVIGACIAGVVAIMASGFAIMYYNAPEEPARKQHTKASPMIHQVKEAKPPVMKRIVKTQPVMRPRPRPVKRVTPPPQRRVVKPIKPKTFDPCKRKKGEIPSRKCVKHHCKRKRETRPSDTCILMQYERAKIQCQKEDHRKIFEEYPGRMVQCLAKYGEDLRGFQYDDFDSVALAALFVQEVRTHYCFTKRIRVCDKRHPNSYAKRIILSGLCGTLHLRLYGRGKWCKRNYLCYMKTAKSDKIKAWLKEKARVARTKRIRTQWLLDTRKKFPRATKCLDRP